MLASYRLDRLAGMDTANVRAVTHIDAAAAATDRVVRLVRAFCEENGQKPL
jgi:hypothetical protein